MKVIEGFVVEAAEKVVYGFLLTLNPYSFGFIYDLPNTLVGSECQ
jgi:hypothetical protein